MNRLPYETIGGNLSATDTFAQLIEYLRLAEEDAKAISNLRAARADASGALQWRAIALRFAKTRKVVEELAAKPTVSNVQGATLQ